MPVPDEGIIHHTSKAMQERLTFRHLPAYAAFIKEHHLRAYIQEQITLSRKIDLPLLRLFGDMTDEALIEMSIPSHTEFLTKAVNNNLSEQLSKSLQQWIADEITVIKRDDVAAEDITLVSYVRKEALMKFLPLYTTDVSKIIEIIKEIDIYTIESDTAGTNVYIQLLKNKLNEERHFSESISDTTPGLGYIFDLEQRQIKFANKNYRDYFGFTFEQLQELGPGIIGKAMHPADIDNHYLHLAKFTTARDKEIISWEYRLKDNTGHYNWMRNYASVFKRSTQGNPAEIIGIALNINTEKDTAETLLLREKQLLEAQEQAEVGSFELDVETGKMEVTPQFMKIYEVGDIDFYDLVNNVHPDDRERINAIRDKAIKDETNYESEYRYIRHGKEKILWAKGVVSYKDGRKILTGTVMDVTRHQKMLKELQQNELSYKQAEALSHIGSWHWDLETDICSWSEELSRIYDMDVDINNVPQGITKLLRHPDDATIVDEYMRILRDEQIPVDYNYRIILKNGFVKYLHALGEVSFDKHGKAIAMFGTVQDITEKQELIERLQYSDALYKQAQTLSHIGNWTWDIDTNNVIWTDELHNIYELPKDDNKITLESATSLHHPDDAKKMEKCLRAVLKTHDPCDYYYRIITTTGETKILYTRCEFIEGNGGKGNKIFATVQDVTEQKLAEKKLQEYKDFIEKITDVTPSVIAAYNINTGEYTFVNNAIEKLLGYTPEQIIAGGVAFMISIMHPDDIQATMEKNMSALEAANSQIPEDGESITEFKYRLLNTNGEYRWFHTYGTVFERNEKGLVESVINISMDVTGQEIAEQELFQRNQQLQHSNTSLEEYAYIASHDLKEPLRKISTFSDRLLITQADTLNDEGRSHLKKILEASKRMQKMINDLLSVSLIFGNKAYQESDLNVILAEALQPLDHKIEESGAVIKSDHLPVVVIVPIQWRQLFQNLVNNSLKFSREGVKPKIKITHAFLKPEEVAQYSLIKTKRYLQVKLTDNGIGFDNQYADKIFSMFQRLHTKQDYEGTGIGLSVCKKIVENHDGIIFATGIPGESATFTIIIPV